MTPGEYSPGMMMQILEAFAALAGGGVAIGSLDGLAAIIAVTLGIKLTAEALKYILGWGDANVRPGKEVGGDPAGPGVGVDVDVGDPAAGEGLDQGEPDPAGPGGVGVDVGDPAAAGEGLDHGEPDPGDDGHSGDEEHAKRKRKKKKRTKRKHRKPKKPKKKKTKVRPRRAADAQGAELGYLQEHSTLQTMFNTLDANLDGKLTMIELRPLAKRLKLTQAQLMKLMDLNRNGYVELTEFLTFM